MNWLVHTVTLKDLERGDHVYRWTSPVHSHHGIVLETSDDPTTTLIIEFNKPNGHKFQKSKARIGVTTYQDFSLNGRRSVKRVRYGSSAFSVAVKRTGTTRKETADHPDKIVERALECISGNFGGYNLLSNNCESFAFYCCTGRPHTTQGEVAISSAISIFSGVSKSGLKLALRNVDDLVVIFGKGATSALVAIPINILTEVAFFAFRAYQYAKDQISGRDLIEKTTSGVLIMATSTIGAILGMAIPVPFVGSFIGSVAGYAVGLLLDWILKSLWNAVLPLNKAKGLAAFVKFLQKANPDERYDIARKSWKSLYGKISSAETKEEDSSDLMTSSELLQLDAAQTQELLCIDSDGKIAEILQSEEYDEEMSDFPNSLLLTEF
eukprot:TRINITY_DN14037_c0_g1_i1.p1 TRINITY_DN14037_c0_g1~~TRINITY_DN14037_c0_g1_i1.p1  ORF type:complete len:396 (-),score=47.29 TRINITY_DN14037_c0_g1_i1:44-1186(-)